jgi:hypothetical protein
MKKTVNKIDLNTGLYLEPVEIELRDGLYYTLEPDQNDQPLPDCPPGFYRRWGATGWELVAAKDLRQAAYEAEADVFRDQAISYDEEAKALSDDERGQEAHTATVLAAEARANYLAKKQEIRERFPEGVAAMRLAAAPMAAPVEEEEKYAVMPTGTYHWRGCSSITDSAEMMTPAEIAAGIPDAKACGRCNPPPIIKEAANE